MEVAIKVVRGGFGDQLATQRFKAERQILASLDHPNIARLLDGGALDGRPYVVMEYVRGQPIDEYCDARKLPVRERAWNCSVPSARRSPTLISGW